MGLFPNFDARRGPADTSSAAPLPARRLPRVPLALAPILAAATLIVLRGAPGAFAAALAGAVAVPLCVLALMAAPGALASLAGASTLGLVAASLAAALGGEAGGAALAWLILAPVDAIASGEATLVAASGASALIASAAAGGADALGAPAAAGLARPAVLVMAAVGAATLVGLRAARRRRVRSDAQDVCGLAGDAALLYDRSGRALALAGPRSEAFGLGARELLGRGFFDLVHVADRPAFLQAIAQAARAGEACAGAVVRLRTRAACAEPAFLWLDMRARGDGAGRALAVFRNVAELRGRQEEIEAARERAAAAALSKDHFLASMSHELRTPLNAIIGFSEILREAPADPAKRREYAAIIHHCGQHLLSVVDSILDLSKMRSGAFALSPAPFGVAPLVDDCCDMMRLDAAARDVRLVRRLDENVGEIIADRRACRQILTNLLSNAVKFSAPGGEVGIFARVDGGHLELRVADDGIGVAAQDLERLGRPFFQARSAHERPCEGTGLGLSIVAGLVGLHGGLMSIESEPQHGARVTVRLPLDCRAAAARACADIEIIARYRRDDARVEPSPNEMVKKIA
ncbi:ATP-binding protein [Methylocella sp.]|uniref:sensor histidine kinase n=1 Tax=Methylocella sp. TaxID=1978226 RepID=UPI0037842780